LQPISATRNAKGKLQYKIAVDGEVYAFGHDIQVGRVRQSSVACMSRSADVVLLGAGKAPQWSGALEGKLKEAFFRQGFSFLGEKLAAAKKIRASDPMNSHANQLL
jgi:hypothetical protein